MHDVWALEDLVTLGSECVVLSQDFWAHPLVQGLRGKMQLGPLEGNNAGSTHTRFHHSAMSTRLAVASYKVLERFGMQVGSLNNIAAATATHDLGHPGFSHPPEKLYEHIVGMNHKQYGLKLIDSDRRDPETGKVLQDALRDSRVGIADLKRLLAEEDPAMKLCSDQSLGADKLAYLLLDARQVRFNQMPPNPMSIIRFLAYIDGELGIDVGRRYAELENPLSNVEAVQHFQTRMYTDVYFSPRTAAFDRSVQRAIDLALRSGIFSQKGDGGMAESVMRLWPLADQVVMDRILNGNGNASYDSHVAQRARQSLESYRRSQAYVPVVVFKYRQFAIDHHLEERVSVIDEGLCKAFLSEYKDPRKVTDLEDELERRYDVPFFITFLRKPERLYPGAVPIFRGGKRECTLEDIRPAHYANLRELAHGAVAIRLCVPPDRVPSWSYQAKQLEADFLSLMKERLG